VAHVVTSGYRGNVWGRLCVEPSGVALTGLAAYSRRLGRLLLRQTEKTAEEPWLRKRARV
jgi:hypothetical protein